MAVWSKALPTTASCLSPLTVVESSAGASEKIPSDLGLGGGFASTTFNWLVTT